MVNAWCWAMPAGHHAGTFRKAGSSRARRWSRPRGASCLRKPGCPRRRTLTPLGIFPYLRNKDLALFLWHVAALPDPKTLACSTFFELTNGARLPEFDRFGLFTRDEALTHVGKNLARLLAEISLDALTC